MNHHESRAQMLNSSAARKLSLMAAKPHRFANCKPLSLSSTHKQQIGNAELIIDAFYPTVAEIVGAAAKKPRTMTTNSGQNDMKNAFSDYATYLNNLVFIFPFSYCINSLLATCFLGFPFVNLIE